MMGMVDATPYWTRPVQEIAEERDCMRRIFQSAAPVALIYEAFGGIGSTAMVLKARFPGAVILACDLDERCVSTFNAKVGPPHCCVQIDASKGLATWSPQIQKARGWGASLDFNRFTILDLDGRPSGRWKLQLLEQVIALKPTWLQLTDSACSYLHVNWSRYGLSRKSLDDYIGQLGLKMKSRYGMVLAAKANHHGAAYLRFEEDYGSGGNASHPSPRSGAVR